MANLWVGLDGAEMVGKVLVGDRQGATAGKLIDGGAPVVDWQGGLEDVLH